MSNYVNVKETSSAYLKVTSPDGSVAFVHDTSLEFHDYKYEFSLLQPVSGGNVSTTVGGTVDIDILNCASSRIDSAYVEVTMANSSGAAIHPVALPYIINNIQLILNGSQCETATSADCFLGTVAQSTYEQLEAQAIAQGFIANNVDYSKFLVTTGTPFTNSGTLSVDYKVLPDTTTGIAANSSRKYSMPIPIGSLKQLFVPILATNNAKLRFTFNAGATLLIAADAASIGSLSIQSVVVYLGGQKYSSKVENAIIQQYKAGPHFSRIIRNREQLITLGSVTSGAQVSQVLGALLGTYISAKFTLTASGAASEAQYAFQPMNYISLYDGTGRLYSYDQIGGQIIKQQYATSKYPELVTAYNNIYLLPFSKNPLMDELEQRNSGGLYFTGRNSIRFAAGVTTSLDLRVNAKEQAVLLQKQDGSVEIIELKSNL